MSGMMLAVMGGQTELVAFTITGMGDDQLSPGTAQAALGTQNTGNLIATGNGTTASATWVQPAPPSGSYWSRLILNSGTVPAGSALNTWIAASTSPLWSWTQGTNGSRSANATLQIASDAAGANILASATFDVFVVREL